MPRMKPIKATRVGCLCCGDMHDALPMDYPISVGFGDAHVSCNGVIVWKEMHHEERGEKLWTVADAERAARKCPKRDWRIVLYGPLRGRTYQRHGAGHWVLIEQNEGFA